MKFEKGLLFKVLAREALKKIKIYVASQTNFMRKLLSLLIMTLYVVVQSLAGQTVFTTFLKQYVENPNPENILCLSLAANDANLKKAQITIAVSKWKQGLAAMERLVTKKSNKLPSALDEYASSNYLLSHSEEANLADVFASGDFNHNTGTAFYILSLKQLGVNFTLNEGSDNYILSFPEYKKAKPLYAGIPKEKSIENILRMSAPVPDSIILEQVLLGSLYQSILTEEASNGGRTVQLSEALFSLSPTEETRDMYLISMYRAIVDEKTGPLECLRKTVPGFHLSEKNSPWQKDMTLIFEQKLITLAQDDSAYPRLDTIANHLGSLGLPDQTYFDLRRITLLMAGKAYNFRNKSGEALGRFAKAGTIDIPINDRQNVLGAVAGQIDMALTDVAALDTLDFYRKKFPWIANEKNATAIELSIKARRVKRHFFVGELDEGERLMQQLESEFPDMNQYPSVRSEVANMYAEASAAYIRDNDNVTALTYLKRGLKSFPEDATLLRRKKLLTDAALGKW